MFNAIIEANNEKQHNRRHHHRNDDPLNIAQLLRQCLAMLATSTPKEQPLVKHEKWLAWIDATVTVHFSRYKMYLRFLCELVNNLHH